jgi:dihydrofolate reductase
MTKVTTGLSMSLDGFIAGPEDSPSNPLGNGGGRLFDWFGSGDTPSRFYDAFRMSPVSAAVFDDGAGRVGAMISGRRTYDITNGWGGDGPLPGVPLFVLTHTVPSEVPQGSSTYTFVTDGIESAIKQAVQVAGDKDVSLMGASPVQQAIRAGLMDEIEVDVVPVLLGGGVRLLDHLGDSAIQLEKIFVVDAPDITHMRYRIVRKA